MSCGVGCGGGGGGDGSEAADGVGGLLSPPPETACAGNLAVVAMDTLPWLRLPAETSNNIEGYHSIPQSHTTCPSKTKRCKLIKGNMFKSCM